MCWVFVNACGLSLAAVSKGRSLVAVLRLLLLRSTGSRLRGLQYLQHVGSAAAVQLPSWPVSHPRVLQKASPFHTGFPSPGLAPAPPAGVHCPLTSPWHPGHILSTLAPRAVHALSQSSVSPSPALMEEPMKASRVGLLKAGRGARCRHVLG